MTIDVASPEAGVLQKVKYSESALSVSRKFSVTSWCLLFFKNGSIRKVRRIQVEERAYQKDNFLARCWLWWFFFVFLSLFFFWDKISTFFLFSILFFSLLRGGRRARTQKREGGGGGVRVVKVDFYILKKLNLQDRGESPLLLLLFTTKFEVLCDLSSMCLYAAFRKSLRPRWVLSAPRKN